MDQTKSPEIFGYVAMINGKFRGVISPECGEREVTKFCMDYINQGGTIVVAKTRADYAAILGKPESRFL